ncbi:MAG: hypothetical protein WC140_04645 [Bacteroidales bacterium]
MKKLLFILSICLISSCGVLSRKQTQMIQDLSMSSDSITYAPSMIINNLSEVRQERAIYYCASLNNDKLHKQELDRVYATVNKEKKIAIKCDKGVNVLESYLRVLRSLSSTIRYKSYGTEIRGMGRKLDSLVDQEDIKTTSYFSAYLTESYMRKRQIYVLRKFIVKGDVLVLRTCNNISTLLKNEDFTDLIENERKGLDMDYLTYLRTKKSNIESDKEYLRLKAKIDNTEYIRRRCISSLNSLKKAHHKLKILLVDEPEDESKTADEVVDAIIDLNDQCLKLRKLYE